MGLLANADKYTIELTKKKEDNVAEYRPPRKIKTSKVNLPQVNLKPAPQTYVLEDRPAAPEPTIKEPEDTTPIEIPTLNPILLDGKEYPDTTIASQLSGIPKSTIARHLESGTPWKDKEGVQHEVIYKPSEETETDNN